MQNYAGSLDSGQFPLPNVRAAVNAGFDLADQLLAQQRDVANRLLDAGTTTGEALAHVGQPLPSTSGSATEGIKRPRAERTSPV